MLLDSEKILCSNDMEEKITMTVLELKQCNHNVGEVFKFIPKIHAKFRQLAT